MLEMRLRHPGSTYSTCRPFTKNKEKIQKFKETRNSRYTYQNKLDKAYFQHDLIYGDFKDLPRRTAAEKVLQENLKNKKYMYLFKTVIGVLILLLCN